MGFKTTINGDKIIIAGGHVNAFVVLRVFKNNFTPTKLSVAADFTEADFDSYGAVTLAYGLPFVNSTPRAQINAASHTWVKGVGPTPNNTYGIYITDGGGIVTGFEIFPAMVPMVTDGVDSIFYQFSPTQDCV